MTDDKPIGAPSDTALWLIAAFKLLKCALLVTIGVITLKLVNTDAEEVLSDWADNLHIATNNRYIEMFIATVAAADDRSLQIIAISTFMYAAVLLTEGIGLMLRKTWAEILTVITTTSFIPIEVYELTNRVTPIRILVIGINVAVVWYLARRLKWERTHQPTAK